MSWQGKEPGHQQPWYWPSEFCKICFKISLDTLNSDFTQAHFHVPSLIFRVFSYMVNLWKFMKSCIISGNTEQVITWTNVNKRLCSVSIHNDFVHVNSDIAHAAFPPIYFLVHHHAHDSVHVMMCIFLNSIIKTYSTQSTQSVQFWLYCHYYIWLGGDVGGLTSIGNQISIIHRYT